MVVFADLLVPRQLLCHRLPADSQEENVPLHNYLLLPGRNVCHRVLDQVSIVIIIIFNIIIIIILFINIIFNIIQFITFTIIIVIFILSIILLIIKTTNVIIIMIIIISFLVPPESVPGRMTILVTVFLVLVNIFNSITSNIPKADGLTAIEMFMIVNIIFVFCALIGLFDRDGGNSFISTLACFPPL